LETAVSLPAERSLSVYLFVFVGAVGIFYHPIFAASAGGLTAAVALVRLLPFLRSVDVDRKAAIVTFREVAPRWINFRPRPRGPDYSVAADVADPSMR
jgi:hypothetical protein